jgi:uncharacterized protein involved in outer membrane biogenesis
VKKIVLGVLVVVALVVLGAAFYVSRLVSSLDTPEFRARVGAEASSALGARVELDALDVSLLRGIRLRGIRVANPAGFRGQFLTADLASLSYRPWSLVSGRIDVDEIKIAKPVVTLVSNAEGAFNYEKLMNARSAAAAARPKGPVSSAPGAPLPALRISRFALEDARILVLDDKNAATFRMDDADLTASLGLVKGAAEGTGRADVAVVSLADVLFLRDVKAPFQVSSERMSLAPLKAKLAGGAVSGDIQVVLKPAVRYGLTLDAAGADVATLLKEAGATGTLAGKLKAKASFSGTAGVATVKGDGRADIADCRWPKAPIFGVLAGLLQLPELSDPRLEDCHVEFTVASAQARMPVISFKGPALQLTGQGTTHLLTGALDYRMNLALAPALIGRIPSGTVRAAFKTRPDGFGAIDFKVTGTTQAPQTDLAQSLGKSVAIEAAKSGLGRFFHKGK